MTQLNLGPRPGPQPPWGQGPSEDCTLGTECLPLTGTHCLSVSPQLMAYSNSWGPGPPRAQVWGPRCRVESQSCLIPGLQVALPPQMCPRVVTLQLPALSGRGAHLGSHLCRCNSVAGKLRRTYVPLGHDSQKPREPQGLGRKLSQPHARQTGHLYVAPSSVVGRAHCSVC